MATRSIKKNSKQSPNVALKPSSNPNDNALIFSDEELQGFAEIFNEAAKYQHENSTELIYRAQFFRLINKAIAASNWYDKPTFCGQAGLPGAISQTLLYIWERENRIFSIDYDGKQLYPSYEFGGNFKPLPAMQNVLSIFRDKSKYFIAAWFASENSWLRNHRPLDLIQEDPESVVKAAEIEVTPIDHG